MARKIKTIWYWRKSRHIDQQNRIEGQSAQEVLHTYAEVIFEKRTKDQKAKNTFYGNKN